MMNLDDVIEGWRSQDASTFYGVVDKTRLHQVLRHEQAKLEKQSRMGLWGGYVFGVAPLFINSGLFLLIMLQPNDGQVRIVWDYVVGVTGVAAAIVVAWTLLALRRSQRARDEGFGDSLRDHLRRRVAQIDDAMRERRLSLITLAAGLICAVAIPVAQFRIGDVPVPYSEMDWPSPFWTVVMLGLLCLQLFWWAPRREQRKNLPRRRQLEAMLKELDGQ
jgi:uncharacterized membrane protein YecN with MAPEG domain